MSSIHEEQDCCQTIKAAEVVNVTNNTQYILNLHFNRQKNTILTENTRDTIGLIEYFFRPRRSRYYEEQQELTKRSAIHCPEPNLVSRCTSNTTHKRIFTHIKNIRQGS